MLLLLPLLGLALASGTNPTCPKTTIRKEVNDVSESDWKMIVETIQKAQQTPEKDDPDNLSVWEAAADLHNELAEGTIHNSCMFFFWHRVYLVEIEKKLQQINKDFFFPYWDSPKQWKDADDAALWKHLGGRGKKVPNDIFGGKPFKLKSMNKPLQRAEGSLNKRLVQAAAYDVATKNSIQMKTGFGNWHEEMEVPKINKQYHGTVHMEIGGKDESSLGQMSTMASPLDPIFYLHHAHLDNLWAQAQVQWKANNFTQYGTTCTKSDKIPFYNVTLEDVLEPKNLCIAYESPKALSGKEIDLPDPPSNNRAGPVGGTNETMAAIKGHKKPTSTVSKKAAKKTNAPKGKGKQPKSKALGPKTSAPKPAPTGKAKGIITSKPRENSNSYGKSDKPAKYGEKKTGYNPFKKAADWFKSKSKNHTASREPKRAGYAFAVASSKPPETVSTSVNVTRHHNSSFVSPLNSAVKTNAGSNQISQEDIEELCPERLPTFWLKKQGGDLAKLEREQDQIQEKCEKLKADIKAGKRIEALPFFDFLKRPWISKPKPPINPKSTSNRKLKKGKQDASAKTNDGKSNEKSLVTTTNPANSKSTQAAKAAPVDSNGRKAANLEAENGTRLESPIAILIALLVAYCTNLMLTA